MLLRRTISRTLSRVFALMTCLLLGFALCAQAVAQTSSTSEFPELISYYDYIRLSRDQQELYISELRSLLADLSATEQQRSVEFIAGSGTSENQQRIQQILDQSHLVLLLSRAFLPPAQAEFPANRSQIDMSCEGGDGVQTLCASNPDGSRESCYCRMKEGSLQSAYCNGQKCDWTQTDAGKMDITKQVFVQRYINGQAQWITKDSIESVKTMLPHDISASLNDYTTDQNKSKVFGSAASSRRIDPSKRLDELVKTGSTTDAITGIKTDHVYNESGLKADTTALSEVAIEKSQTAKAIAPLTKSKNADVAASAQSTVSKNVKETVDASNMAREKGQEAAAETEDKIAEAAKEAPHVNDSHIVDANDDSIHTGADLGISGARLETAAKNTGDASTILSASKDPKIQELAVETKKAQESIKKDAQELRTDGSALLKNDSAMLAAKAPAYSGEQKKDLEKASADAADLAKKVEKSDVTTIQKSEAKAVDSSDKLATDLNVPTNKNPALAKAAGVTCLKTGEFTCPDRHNRKKSQTQFNEMRTTFLAKEGDSKSCIFGGNTSKFDKEAKSRGNKSRVGCTAVTSKDIDIAGKTTTIACPPAKANQKLVLCSPILFGYDKDVSGNPVGRCTDWTSTVTADCNMKFPVRKSSAKNGVSPADFLKDKNNKLEPEWQKLSDTLSSHCNTKEFRSLNCDECSVIAHRLSSMKAKATAGTCTWPSDLGTVRDGMTGNPTKTKK